MNTDFMNRQSVIPHDRAAFLHQMRAWIVRTSRTLDMMPQIDNKPIDPYLLHLEVEKIGGPEIALSSGLWGLVAARMGLVADEQDARVSQVGAKLAYGYAAVLLPFKDFCLERMQEAAARDHAVMLALGQQATGMTSIIPMPNIQSIISFLEDTFKDWLPEQTAQSKLLRAAQMDLPEMYSQGWSPERIAIVQRFRPTLMQYRATFMRQQELQRQAQHAQPQFGQAQQHLYPGDYQPSPGYAISNTGVHGPGIAQGAIKQEEPEYSLELEDFTKVRSIQFIYLVIQAYDQIPGLYPIAQLTLN
ncbi:hypothetical protein RSOLAG22IIIB_06209 [Rhizoctonia solani]|uniref:ARID domain-containing protein n=1 Tax=Rhizoctonia solani TaxID=456999 RepID=A0A0K6GCW6_9AGAM|nr:hypothetical protein RSOLAG22IIIB_06209 [Rhizoctonia solani]